MMRQNLLSQKENGGYNKGTSIVDAYLIYFFFLFQNWMCESVMAKG